MVMDFLSPKVKVIARGFICNKATCYTSLSVVKEFTSSIKEIVIHNDIRKFKVH